jgi:hypothetical protein
MYEVNRLDIPKDLYINSYITDNTLSFEIICSYTTTKAYQHGLGNDHNHQIYLEIVHSKRKVKH